MSAIGFRVDPAKESANGDNATSNGSFLQNFRDDLLGIPNLGPDSQAYYDFYKSKLDPTSMDSDGYPKFHDHPLIYRLWDMIRRDGKYGFVGRLFPEEHVCVLPEISTVVEMCISFFFGSLAPFLQKSKYEIQRTIYYALRNFFDAIEAITMRLIQRSMAGLLRKGQLVVCEAFIRSFFDDFDSFINSRALSNPDAPALRAGHHDQFMIWSYCYLFSHVVNLMLSIRSERIENLMVKYLAEEEICWNVVNSVSEQTRLKLFVESEFDENGVLLNGASRRNKPRSSAPYAS
ncbi:hypothetical protein BJ508DRAFT_309008 [Ascobolus immersus RN42]|uniref:Uncharacterized protein n=1 Tax=Ascobolus immersus RN42 TaxID=1160509 RepID=A0A3N4HXV1_ASCIM|nr:hypothetical protein BJ508DRAFT_309008 [Ascobolus immersus RN42]